MNKWIDEWINGWMNVVHENIEKKSSYCLHAQHSWKVWGVSPSRNRTSSWLYNIRICSSYKIDSIHFPNPILVISWLPASHLSQVFWHFVFIKCTTAGIVESHQSRSESQLLALSSQLYTYSGAFRNFPSFEPGGGPHMDMSISHCSSCGPFHTQLPFSLTQYWKWDGRPELNLKPEAHEISQRFTFEFSSMQFCVEFPTGRSGQVVHPQFVSSLPSVQSRTLSHCHQALMYCSPSAHWNRFLAP